MTHVVGIDLGGTEIKFGLFERETGKRIAYAIAATKDGEDRNGRPTWLAAIAAQLENWSPEQNCLVGIAAPGLASRDERSIAIMPGRLEGLAGLDWTRELEWGSQIRVLNDGHAALLGEVWMGSARSAKDVVMLTLGTGVGGAALVDGRLLRGHIGRGGHFGHLSLDPTGPLDIANAPGSLEDAIGNASVSARTSGRFNSTQELADAVERGDMKRKWRGKDQYKPSPRERPHL